MDDCILNSFKELVNSGKIKDITSAIYYLLGSFENHDEKLKELFSIFLDLYLE